MVSVNVVATEETTRFDYTINMDNTRVNCGSSWSIRSCGIQGVIDHKSQKPF